MYANSRLYMLMVSAAILTPACGHFIQAVSCACDCTSDPSLPPSTDILTGCIEDNQDIATVCKEACDKYGTDKSLSCTVKAISDFETLCYEKTEVAKWALAGYDSGSATEIALDPTLSNATIRLPDSQKTTRVSGSVAFENGDCSATCPVTITMLSLAANDIPDLSSSVGKSLTHIRIINDGPVQGTKDASGNISIDTSATSLFVSGILDGNQFVAPYASVENPLTETSGSYYVSSGKFAIGGTYDNPDYGRLTLRLSGTSSARPPIADAGAPQTVACDPTKGVASVTLDGSRTLSPDGKSMVFAWREGTTALATTQTAEVPLLVGDHTIDLRVVDTNGKRRQAETQVSVFNSGPAFVGGLDTLLLMTCSADSPVQIPLPRAVNLCGSGVVSLTGVVIAENGVATAPIDIVDGRVVVPPGTATIRWTATSDGLSTSAEQTLRIAEKPVLFATNVLRVGDGAAIKRTGGGFGAIDNTGMSMTALGVEANTGAILSTSRTMLADRAHVHGTIVTAATLVPANGVLIDGLVSEHAAPVFPALPTVPSSNATSTLDIKLEPSQYASVTPGSYRSLVVKSRSTLKLSAGTYFVSSLDLEPDATLALEPNGSVLLVVRSELTFRGKLSDPNHATDGFALAYLGQNPVALESAFAGALIAPNAAVTLRSLSQPHVGSFFAKELDVDAHANVVGSFAGCP